MNGIYYYNGHDGLTVLVRIKDKITADLFCDKIYSIYSSSITHWDFCLMHGMELDGISSLICSNKDLENKIRFNKKTVCWIGSSIDLENAYKSLRLAIDSGGGHQYFNGFNEDDLPVVIKVSLLET